MRTPTSPTGASGHLDLMKRKWDGRASGFYEIHYVHWNDRRQRVVGWFRFVLTARPSGPPEILVVGALIPYDRPECTRIFRQAFPADRVTWVDDTTGLEVGANGLRRGRWWGEVGGDGGKIRWDFGPEPGEVAMSHLPDRLYGGPFPPTKIHAPYFRAHYTGEVEVDGRTISLRSVPGNSSHYWGTEVIQDRIWVSCQAFEEDPQFGFEGASGRARVGPLLLPRVTYLCFYWDGAIHNLNGMARSFQNRGRHELTSWEFTGRSGRFRFIGRASGHPDRMIAHSFASPDDRSTFDQWVHTDFAGDLTIRIEQRRRWGWKPVETLTARRTAAFETSRHNRDPRVARIL